MPIRFNFKSFAAIEKYVDFVIKQEAQWYSSHDDAGLPAPRIFRFMRFSPNKEHFYNTLNDAIGLSRAQGNISSEDSSVLHILVNKLFRFMPEICALENLDMYHSCYGGIKDYPNNDAPSYNEKVHEAMENHFKVFRLAIRIYNKHGETLKNDPTMVTLLNSQYAASILGYKVSDDEYQATIRAVMGVTNTTMEIEYRENSPSLNGDTIQPRAQANITDSDDNERESPEPTPLGSSI